MALIEGSNTVIALNGGRTENDLVLDTKLRVETAVDLAFAIRATGTLGRIIMAGGDSVDMFEYAQDYYARRFPITEALPMEYENHSRDTIGNAHFTKKHRNLTPKTDPNIHIVTVNLHSPRGGWTFKRVLGPDFNVNTNPSPNPYSILRSSEFLGNEVAVFALSYLILNGVKPEDDEQREARLLKIHPRYR